MAQILLFHHARGLTAGVVAFADQLRTAGHTVHTPDLFDGRTFDTTEDGVGHAREIGFGTVIERGVRAAGALPGDLVYAGMSMGALPAQQLAQNRPGAKALVLLYSTVAPAEFGEWPAGLRAQIHAKDADPFFVDEGDVDAARELEADGRAELYLYPGDQHLFADSSTEDYDPEAASLTTQRVLDFLAGLG